MSKRYERPHEYDVHCSACRGRSLVHMRLKRVIKRCPRCGSTAIAVTFLQTNTQHPVVR